jgi:4-amino-4-deoxy-L-arabinose transferase-like glycosyltransferase
VRASERAVLVGIVVLVALALRWAFVATAHVPNPLRADAGEYAQCAHNLVEHGVWSLSTQVPPPPDSFRSPGYPLVLAACRVVAGETWYGAVRGLQVVLGALTTLFAFVLARAWLGYWPALAAAALTAFSPHLVVSSAYVLTENVTTALATGGLLALAHAQRHSWGRIAVAGVALGAAAACNETLIVLPFAAACARWRSLGAVRVAVLVAVALVPTVAWAARNASQELARTGSQRAIASISHGSYPGMVFRDPRWRGFPYREDPEQPAFGASWSNLGAVLGRRVAAEPWRYASWYLLEKPVWLWSHDLVQGNGPLVYEVSNSPYDRNPVMAATQALMRWLHAPLMVLAALAAVFGALRPRAGDAQHLLGLVAILATLAYLPVIPDPRYLQPVRPVLFVLGAGAVAALVMVARQRFARTATASAASSSAAAAAPAPMAATTAGAPPSE